MGTVPLRRLLMLALLVLGATGCQARLTVDVAVDRDGAGTLAVALGADAALLAEAAAAGVDPLGELAAAGAALAGAGWSVGDTRDVDGGRTVQLSTPFGSPAELEALAAEVAGALAGPELVPLEDLRLAVEEETLRVSAVAGLVPTEAVTALGVQPEQAVRILEDTEALRYDVRVTLPGEVLETNATAAGELGEPLVWAVPPGERIALVVVTERPRTAWWPFAVAGAVGVLLLVGLLVLARGAARRRPVAAASPTGPS